ncbi:MAG: hypothetical protein IJ074_11615 [Clostridia bacterium]|nr:hypothetical protein [Clostridia bacterium]MBQ8973711.1 hypothetical protein [Clostridia bacterium]
MERDRRGRLPWAIVLIIIAFSCIIAYSAAWIVRQSGGAQGFASYSSIRLDSARKLQTVKDGFVYYDGSSITKVGSGANIQWSYVVGANADFEANESGVASWVGGKLTLIDPSNGAPSYSGTLDGDILSARVGSEYAAAVLGPEHDSTIILMETGGRRVDSITLSNQTVVDYGFFYKDSLFWVMTLDTNGTAPACTVSTYRPGKRLVGSITDSEQTLYHVNFQSSQICCTGNTYMRVYAYNGTEEAAKRKLVYGWTLVDADTGSDNPLMAFTLNDEFDGASLIRDVRMLRGTEEQTVRMPYGCMDIVASEDKIYGFSTDGYIMIGRMGQQRVDAYQISLKFDQVYGVINGNIAVLGNGNEIYLLSLS